jgi:formylglycine-generating enzyme required for sulfatase activity
MQSMKRLIGWTGFAALVFSFSAHKERSFAPPGAVQINDTLFADITEVSNIDWLTYTEETKKLYGANSGEYKITLPDTLVWRQKLALSESYVDYYFRHPAYHDYPVVGVSREQALNYCRWRTERVHAWLEIQEGKRKAEDLCKPYTGAFRFEYRLPTKQEWEGMAIIGPDPKEKEKYTKKKGTNLYKLYEPQHISMATELVDNDQLAAPVKSYLPNSLGMYNLIGNVCEMVMEKGISKGGSWRHDPNLVNVWKDDHYDAPNSWTGFRCICILKKKTGK